MGQTEDEIPLERYTEKLERRIRELEVENARLKDLATKDTLTGIYNRRGIGELLQQEVASTQRGTGGSLLVIYFDLDHFKKVNDTYGHARGDAVLIEFAKIIQENKRDTDFWGRHGGEEFLLIAPTKSEITKEEVAIILERYSNKVRTTISNGDQPQTVSIGCAILRKDDQGTNCRQIIHLADRALYESKASGRNRFTIFEPQTPVTPPSV